MKTRKLKFTVLLLVPTAYSNQVGDTYLYYGQDATVEDAIVSAQREACAHFSLEYREPDYMFAVLFAAEGHVDDINPDNDRITV
jgi:hypothetical protein